MRNSWLAVVLGCALLAAGAFAQQSATVGSAAPDQPAAAGGPAAPAAQPGTVGPAAPEQQANSSGPAPAAPLPSGAGPASAAAPPSSAGPTAAAQQPPVAGAPDRRSEQILTQEVREQTIGRRTGRVARTVREEIVQELQENKLGSPEDLQRLSRLIDVLIVVANTHVPEVVDDLRSARAALDALLTQEHLAEASRTQQVILDLLAALVEKLSARERLGSLVQQAEELVTRQQELNTDTRQTALKTIGKPLENLKPEERQALSGLSQRQQDLRQRYQQLEDDISRSAQELSPTEPQRAQSLEAAREFGRSQRIEPNMNETAGELQQNQVLSAAQKEQQTLTSLQALRDRLAATDENSLDELLRRQRDLEALTAEQQALRDETGRMTPQSPPDALAALAQRQGDLAQRSQQLASQLAPTAPQSSQNVGQAGQHMEQASNQLDQSQPQPATQEQDQALQALQAARQALGLQLSQMGQMQMAGAPFDQRLLDILSQQREQMGLLQRLSEDLSALNDLVSRQDAEGKKTAEESAKPEGERQPQPLAAAQKEIAERAAEVGRRVGEYDQESASHVTKAQEQLGEAAGKLEQAQLQEARPPQEQGLAELKQGRDILEDKFKRILALLAQLQSQRRELGEEGQEEPETPEPGSLDELIELANNLVELQRLARDQEGTKDQTTQAEPEQAEALAPEQGKLKGRAEDLSGKVERLLPEPAGDIRQAGGEMGQAQEKLGVRLPKPAVGHQESALQGLYRADEVMSATLREMLAQQMQMMVQMMVPSQTLDPRDEMRLRLAGLEALAEQMGTGAWRVGLPPQARQEVSQSLQERFPKGYEALLRTYFQDLAQSQERAGGGQ